MKIIVAGRAIYMTMLATMYRSIISTKAIASLYPTGLRNKAIGIFSVFTLYDNSLIYFNGRYTKHEHLYHMVSAVEKTSLFSDIKVVNIIDKNYREPLPIEFSSDPTFLTTYVSELPGSEMIGETYAPVIRFLLEEQAEQRKE